MFVLKSTYNRALSKAEALKDAAAVSEAIAERSLRSAENALAHKEKCHAAEVAKLKHELKHAQNKISNQKKQIQSFEQRMKAVSDNAGRLARQVDDLERQLAAATKVTYVVTPHRNNALASIRYSDLNEAINDAGLHRPPTEHGPQPRIFALIGDTVIADVTDPDKWDETLPVSEKRESIHESAMRRFWDSIEIR